ncbi:MAG: NADH-quinone oxidoreductase subunit L [Gemmataceae bacterium]|nr:NADH-quinone oxidoreductase subunit L [Gemmataceae bacterium]
MIPGWEATPGRLYVLATAIPLVVTLLLALAGLLRGWVRPLRARGGVAQTLYWVLGGDVPLRAGAYLAVAGMTLTALLSLLGLTLFLTQTATADSAGGCWAERIDWVRVGPMVAPGDALGTENVAAAPPALALQVGYRIDALTAVLFAMVAVVSLCIFVFALGYMDEETQAVVEDHEAQHQYHRHTPVRRRGRFGRFYLFLSLFCFAMLHLLIADNLFQIFVSWELVGVCSFWLIGFYQERPSASQAANKAFIMNRVGDAGFLIGIAIAWSHLGTLNLDEIFRRLRGAEGGAGEIRRVQVLSTSEAGLEYVVVTGNDWPAQHVLLHPLTEQKREVFRDATESATANLHDYTVMPYWLWLVMGLGIFLGCVGKSAQWPLHTWLPDAMEGPTPVSALIHAATMVAAGVYLVGRCFPLFAPEVFLTIAYVGAITAFLAATIALVQTDIKRILAYSTCSQLGLMFLALGLGGWTAGLLHLVTHAFFKALLFLGAGSVIHACGHVQDITRLGGLYRKMPITALTMLVGVLAIAGFPFLSGWYSKERILSQVMGLGLYQPEHILLWLLPLLTTIMTSYYMFRLWLTVFTGPPRDKQLHDQVHESPAVMTVPLLVLAVLSGAGAWGWPLWEVEASWLGQVLEKAQPAMVREFAAITERGHQYHTWTGIVALACTLVGAAAAYLWFGRTPVTAEQLQVRTLVGRFLWQKWYFDEAYEAIWVRPTVRLASGIAAADKRSTTVEAGIAAHPPSPDRSEETTAEEATPPRFDWGTLDGWLNSLGDAAASGGAAVQQWQSGRLRLYVLTLALTVVVLLAMLVVLAG